MLRLFSKEKVHTTAQDTGRLRQLESHDLLRQESAQNNIASFHEVAHLGELFLERKFKRALLSTHALPTEFASSPQGQRTYLCTCLLGKGAELFPATVQPIQTPTGLDLRVFIVPIPLSAFQKGSYERHSDSMLALAAAAAVAPQFLIALDGGIQTTHCETKKDPVSITPDHGAPLSIVFDAMSGKQDTLQQVTTATRNSAITLKDAGHLHGKSAGQTQSIVRAASGSQVAAGVEIETVLRSQLPSHALFFETRKDDWEREHIVTLDEALRASLPHIDLSLVSAALGFTAHVIGDQKREDSVKKILRPANNAIPLTELLRK